MERNEAGQLQAVAGPAEPLPTHGLIDLIRNLDARIQRIEDKLWPPVADGSGTERYDNWTQVSDGSNYPGSYGVSTERKPFVPFSDDLEPTLISVDGGCSVAEGTIATLAFTSQRLFYGYVFPRHVLSLKMNNRSA